MAGALFHNGFLLKKPFEYQLMPMYGFYGSKLAGIGKLTYNFFPRFANIRSLSFSVSGLQFAYDEKTDFNKWKVEAKIIFRNNDFKFFPKHTAWVNFSQFTSLYDPANITNTNLFNLNYQFQNPDKVNLTKVSYNVKANGDFGRTSIEIIYNLKPQFFKTPLTLRLFSGYLFNSSSKNLVNSFILGGRNGLSDIEYEGLFPGRFDADGMWAHQFMPVEGGFAVPYYMISNKFIISAGFEFKPLSKSFFKLLKIYGNAAWLEAETPVISANRILYEAGVKVGQTDFLEVYFPVLYNKKDLLTTDYKELIRFNLNLKVINPFGLLERIPRM